MEKPDRRHIVIFDGVCGLCIGAVNFVLRRDPKGIFLFTPIQSDFAQELMKVYGIDTTSIDTFVLIKNNQSFVFSSAALEIAKDLTGLWYLFNVFKLLPSFIRDAIYKTVARHRYRFFGRQETCMVPTEEIKSRFVGV